MARLVAVEREHELPDLLIGSRLRICDDDTGSSYSDGVVAAVDIVKDRGARKEFLRMKVDCRVINGLSVAEFTRELAVDCEIPMHRVKMLHRSPQSAATTRREAVAVTG